jgi:hypothetical protein
MVPFNDLWIDGGETEKRPPCPQRVIEPAKILKAISETRHEKELYSLTEWVSQQYRLLSPAPYPDDR